MKKGHKVIGIILVLAGWGAIISVKEEGIASLILGFVLIFAGIFLAFPTAIAKLKKSYTGNDPQTLEQQPVARPVFQGALPQPKLAKKPLDKRGAELFEKVTESGILKYQYEKDLCTDFSEENFEFIIDSVKESGREFIRFVQEPENIHDSKAVAVYIGGAKVGYIYKGTIQDMVNDYLKKGWEVQGYINTFDKETRTATYKIGFYKPFEALKSKKFKLTKVNRDALDFCSEGDCLNVEKDFDENYVVNNQMVEEIGRLPKTAVEYLEKNDYSKIVGVLRFDENDFENTKPIIEIFLA